MQVNAGGNLSDGLPFIVTKGVYAGSCPASPPSSELEITTASLPNGTVNQGYSASLAASGGKPPYTWSLVSGSLPAGLSLAPSSGAITGTPTAPVSSDSITVQAIDSAAQATDAVLTFSVAQTVVSATVYSYSVPLSGGYDGAGNIKQFSDSVMGTWNFGYDSLNRLHSGVASSGSYNGQSLCLAYDSFGNRTEYSVQTACPSNPTLITYPSSNRVPGYKYDSSGNVLSDGANSYAYDGEGRLCAVQSTPITGGTVAIGYLNDAEGRRVAKGSITPNSSQPCNPAANGFTLTESYVLGQGGEQLTTLDQNSNWIRTNVYGAGQMLATYDTAGLHFHLTDPLGTRRLQTNAQGQPELDCQSLPFGDQQSCFPDANATASPGDATPLHFTGKERDAESGLDYFGARYFGSSMGRWTSPDWSSDPDPVPYADFEDPQSLNLYSYVQNNPLSNRDSEGHEKCKDGTEADACVYADPDPPLPTINWDLVGRIAQQTLDVASQAAHQFTNIMTTPGGVGCMASLAAGGGTAGAVIGGGVGLAGLAGGGVAVVVTEPAGLAIGGAGGAASGLALGMTICPGGAASGGGGGRGSGSSARLTKPQQRQTAKYLGMKEVKGVTSQGQPVFEKDGRYFSFSNTSHAEGEVFKEVDRNGGRLFTTDINFNRIGR